MTNPTLEELASEDLIRTSDPTEVAQVRAILEGLTPTTMLTDGLEMLTASELAAKHQNSRETWEEPMDEAEAWEWACRDVVFFGYHPL